MDFNSLAVGSPFYVLRKTADKPILEVGTVKGKTPPQPKYQSQAVPSAFNGTNIQNVLTLTATINGQDVVFQEIPVNVEIAARGTDTFSGSREAMLQAVDAMIQASKKALEMEAYHKAVAVEGEKMLEALNPRYAEEKRQAKSIEALEQRQTESERKLDSILAILQKLDSPTPTKKPD
ncbi:MAG: hypothetical protein J6T12_02480 [Salinivirgaceae bacterium]|nr:hypothetical protein [Salinivirgaceae bacterium]